MMTVYLAELTIRSNSTILFHALRCPSIILLNSSPQKYLNMRWLPVTNHWQKFFYRELSVSCPSSASYQLLLILVTYLHTPTVPHPALFLFFPLGFGDHAVLMPAVTCGFLLPSYLLPFIACICCICTSRRAQSYSEGVADSTSFPGYLPYDVMTSLIDLLKREFWQAL